MTEESKEEDRWSFGTISRNDDGLTSFRVGEAVPVEQLRTIDAALDLLTALSPSGLTEEFEVLSDELRGALSRRAQIGGPPSPSHEREVQAAVTNWLGSFTRLRAHLEAQEERYGIGDVARAMFARLHREDAHYRLAWELRNVSQHEGDAHSYLSYRFAIDPVTEARTESFSIDLERLYSRSRIRGIEGVRGLWHEQRAADVPELIDRLRAVHYEVVQRLLAANTASIDSAIALVADVAMKHGRPGAQLQLFKFGADSAGFAAGEPASFTLRPVDVSILATMALELSIARARFRDRGDDSRA